MGGIPGFEEWRTAADQSYSPAHPRRSINTVRRMGIHYHVVYATGKAEAKLGQELHGQTYCDLFELLFR